jgi:hypothetical protein
MSRAKRFGISIGRGWMLMLLVVAALVGVAYWLGPLRAPPPALELLIVEGDQSAADVAVRGERDPESGTIRYTLPLAVRNVGFQSGRPQTLTFSVPGRYRLVTAQGPLDSEVTPGVPLRRYVLTLAAPTLRPGEPPQRLPGLETIWLEPDMPDWYCIDNNGVPEFIPAPEYDATALAEVRIFYSLGLRRPEERSTGVLTVRVDPEQYQRAGVAMPPTFPTTLDDFDTEPPDLGPLQYSGERRAYCGDPEQPMELFTVAWETTGGAGFYVIYVHDRPRKHLYDMNGDGTVDLEMWDADGDGRFDARREARYPVPEFLRPRPRPGMALLEPDTVPPDSAWLALFNEPRAGPFRFTRPQAAPAAPLAELGPLPPPDSAWLARFLEVDAGPFRFTRPAATPTDTAPPRIADEPGTEPGEPGAPGTPPAAEPPVAEPDSPAATTPAPQPPPRRTAPLGTPVRPPGGGAP